ncbi:MAG TPA: glucose-1-phosphate cytidylyltransferase [Woeseiaceae bacterium]|nr:glucose-1-phosphate cytidylyltransferase [Woeseiaceae bacterium]
MKVVILAGGYGTRLSEETAIRPKPLVEVGGQPILWHIMKIYSAHGLTDFVICGGYKCSLIKAYFRDYALDRSDMVFDYRSGTMFDIRRDVEPWRITVVDTGENTMTGGRIKRVLDHVDGETFCLTYGDGVSDVDVGDLIRHHRESGALATVTAVQQPGRFGALALDHETSRVRAFREKSNADGGLINGGYFVVEPSVGDYIAGDDTVWEQEPMRSMAHDGKLSAYRHFGFWQNMDTLRDKMVLEKLWAQDRAPWRVWQ